MDKRKWYFNYIRLGTCHKEVLLFVNVYDLAAPCHLDLCIREVRKLSDRASFVLAILAFNSPQVHVIYI